MRSLLALFSLAFLCGFQDPAAKPDFREEVKALRAEYQKAEQEYYKPYREAKTDEERRKIKLDPAQNPAPVYLEKFQELAGKAKGTTGGAEALIEVFSLGQRAQKKAEARKAVETLVTDYIESPVMERLANGLRYAGYQIGDDVCRAALSAIQEKSPLPNAKAAAIFNIAAQDIGKDPEGSRTAFIRLAKEFKETPYAARADKFLFEIEHLQVGKTAPDFEATDEKGAKYKLSDYRGKVTVVDFWGFW